MRRLSLTTKLIAAAAPLVLAVVALLALTLRSDYHHIQEAQSGAVLGGVWEPLIEALDAVEAEAATLNSPDPVTDPDTRRATDQAINELREAIKELNAFDAASQHVTTARSSMSAARRTLDMAAIAPQMVAEIDPAEAYGSASRELVAVGQLLPPEAGDPQLGSELLAVVKLAEAKLHANDVIASTSQWPNPSRSMSPLVQARVAFASLVSTLGEFEAIAPDDWATQYRQSGFTTSVGTFRTSLDSVTRAADAGEIETFDTAAFTEFTEQGVGFQRSVSQSIVDRANTEASSARTSALIRSGIILLAVLLAVLLAWFITRSITRRVKAVADSANRVATEQLPALVEALRDPRGKAVLPAIDPVDARGNDDLSELAHAFNSMQETLIDVAHEQVEVLRRGVSDIFVTMARRNRSLIDRQLAMLDEYEAAIDDPEILGNYYQLDHLATRMRRNSESLLVLANAEPKRRRVKATEIDDVVRASIGEVEDYTRIEIQHLESLQVSGSVVADISHLLAELLDNATSFSPPDSPVRVGGRKAGDSYMLRIVDDGVGIAPERLRELNELLREPPIVGLSVESTLGVSVVSLLANKHNIEVTLSAGSPGLTVDVILPGSLFGPIDAPVAPAPAIASADGSDDSSEQIVAWNDQPDAAHDESFQVANVAQNTPPPFTVPEPKRETITAEQVASEPATSTPNVFDTVTEPGAPAAPAPAVFEPAVFEPVAPNPADAERVAPAPADFESVATTPDTSTQADLQPADFDPYERRPDTQGPAAAQAPATIEASDWTKMSLDLSAFTTGSESPAAPTIAQADVPTIAQADVPTITDPVATPAAADAAPVPTLDDESPTVFPDLTGPSLPSFDTSAPATPGEPVMPPPPARPHGEFDTPLAPPITANPLTQRPVTPDTARPLPANPMTPAADIAPALPTRTNRGSGPEGPDRLADQAAAGGSPVAASEPSALQAALSAFDTGRNAVGAQLGGDLPTRARGAEPVPFVEEPSAVTQSRVDPAALRDRLRAFQTEFSNAGDSGNDIYTDTTNDQRGTPR